jgi:hypothetical protein
MRHCFFSAIMVVSLYANAQAADTAITIRDTTGNVLHYSTAAIENIKRGQRFVIGAGICSIGYFALYLWMICQSEGRCLRW